MCGRSPAAGRRDHCANVMSGPHVKIDGMEREVIYGRNPVRELVRAERRRVHAIWATQEASKEPWLPRLHPKIVERGELGKAAGTGDHQGVIAFADPYPYATVDELLAAPGPIICLDQLQDPRNLGAVARVVDAVGAAGIALPKRGSPDVTGAVCKTSAGAVEHILVCQVDNVAGFLHDARGQGRWAYGAESSGGGDYRAAGMGADSMIVIGAEGEGLRPRVKSMCDRLVHIPMAGHVDSLNLSVSAALLLFETTEKPQPSI